MEKTPPNDETGGDAALTGDAAVREGVIEAMKRVEDPELFLDVWFLGLIYSVEVTDGDVAIEMTFTSVACPAGPELVGRVKEEAAAVPGVSSVEVTVVFSPPWTPSDDVKLTLGLA